MPITFDANILADNAAVFTELSTPQIMAEDNHPIRSGTILLRRKPATQRRRHPQHRQQSRCNPCAIHAFGYVLVAGIAIMEVVGILLIRKIVNIDV